MFLSRKLLSLLLSLLISSNVYASEMIVKQFEWSPSVVLVGEAATFYWNIENAESCFGNNKTRTTSGNNGVHRYSYPQNKVTSWTCTDSSGNTIDLRAYLTVEEIPSVPNQPLVSLSENEVNLAWNRVEGAYKYEVYYQYNSSSWRYYASKTSPSLKAIFEEPGTYQFRLNACTSNNNCSGYSLTSSINIPPPPLQVKEFEWRPSVIAVGQSSTFYWEVENAEYCYGNNKSRPAKGNNGVHVFNDEVDKLTQWYCKDKYGARLPSDPNQFLEANMRVVSQDKADSPGCFNISNFTEVNHPIIVSWCDTAKAGVSKFELFGELEGKLFSGSPGSIANNSVGQYQVVRPALSEGREYCYKVRASFDDGSVGAYTETKCTVIGEKVFEEPNSFFISLESNKYRLEWSSIAGADHYLLEQRKSIEQGGWYEFTCGDSKLQSTNCLTELDESDFIPELGNKAVFRVSACNAQNVCGDYKRANISFRSSEQLASYADVTSLEPANSNEFSEVLIPSFDNAGALKGQASVSGGAATYHIPIELPPGRAGMQPNVSLNYSSRSGNGIAGVGWSLSAGSSITRCAATFAQDGFTQNPQYNSNDRLCLDGQRLIATSGTYGNSGTQYRTEIDSFVRVTQNGSLNGSSTWFKVEDKSGSVAYYGKTANSRLIHTGKSASYSWLVDYQHDSTNMNFINYEYIDESAGEKLLQAIYYTENSATSTDGQSVEFEYEDKNIFYSSFAAGGESRTTQRLKSITVNSFGNEIRKYSLAYKTSTASGRGLLQSVQLCENGTNCFEPTLFDWHDSEQSYVVEPMGENGNMLYSNISSLIAVLPRGDINGDGVRDWQGYYVNAEGEFTQNNIQFENCSKNPFTLQSECHDGDFDLDGRSDEWFINSGVLKIKLSSSGSTINAGISMPVSTYFGLRDSHIRSIADFNNDGWPDVAVFKPGATPKVEIYLNVKSKTSPFSTVYKTFNLTKYSAGSSKYTLSTDINSVGDLTGDGTIDFIKVKTGAGNRISFLQPIPTELYLGDDNYSNVHSSPFDVSEDPLAPGLSYLMDINGDGLSDWLGLEYQGSSKYLTYRLNEGNLAFASEVLLDSGLVATKPEYIYHSSSEQDLRTVPKYLGAFKIEDINNDGKAELLMPEDIVFEGCASISTLYPSEGSRMRCGDELYGFYHASPNSLSKQSINSSTADKSIYQFSAIHFTQSKSGTISATKKLTPIIGSAYDSAFVDAFGTGLRSFVFNHKLDEGYSFNGSASGEFSGYEDDYGIYINRNYGAGSGNDGTDYSPVDIIKSTENGLGVKSEWYLRPLTSNSLNYDRLESEVVNGNDYFNFASSMYVVANFKQSNGLGGFNESKYNYLGAVYNGQGRGFMGFKSITVEDVTKGIVTQSDFEQVFPYQGKLTRQATFAKENYGSHNLLNAESSETQALSFKEIEWLDNLNHSVTGVYSIYPKTTKIVTRLPSTSEGSSNSYSKTKVSTQTVTVNSIDKYGNVTEKVTQLTDGWGVNKTTEVMSYDYDESAWFIDKLTAKTVTKHALMSRNSQDPITSTTELDPTTIVVTDLTNYHANRKPRNITVSGLHGTSTSGKGKTTVTTYNDYGLPTQVSATAQVLNSSGSWVNQTRTTKTAYSKDGNTIAVDGYFPYELKNAKNHLSYTHVNPATGKVTKTRQQLSGSSYLTTDYTYDDYNRPFSSQTDGQPVVYTAVQFPDAQTPTNAVLQVVSVSAGQPTQKIYQDKLGRVLRTAVEDFNGDWVFTDVEYNDLGYKIFESIPYKEGSTAYGVSYTGYDILGRLTEKVTNQHCGDMTTTYAYAGLRTDITASEDCEGKAIDMSRTYNSLKQLMETVDANNGVTRYSYNTLGLPVVIQDANGNNIIAKYNALGRKTQVNDPNQGVTNFEYNGFGELQREARVDSQTLTFITDVLGRVTRRTAEGEDTLNYTYDGEAYGLGQLNQATGNGVTKSFSFDSLGRATTQTIAGSGKTYKTTTFYDANYGRVKGLRYPNNLAISYDYTNSGYLQSIKNTASGYIYKTVTDQDAFGNITAADLGNGTSETSTFSSRNGQMLLKAINKAGNSLMNISYQSYDGFGNLKQVDVTTGNVGIDLHQFTETYDYDNLHRLERNYVDGYEVTSYSYDAIGNLLSKSDYASEYDYSNGSTGGPNAVKRVYRNGWKSIGYDARGNMTSGDGLTSAIYNAMDKPTQIKKAGKTLDFTYGPQHMRFKQVNGSVTTFYSDKLYEEEVNGSKTTWRAYVDDIAVISQTSNESATIRYTHKDRLGSARIFTDKNGYVTAQRNFDPFGKPRLASGSLMPYGNSKLNDLDKAKTRRGFTDHEHLDDVELIHMNGRVYDYNLGRFMSVDPVIQSPTNSQSINPYSYIMNNPLAGTDPTGYTGCAASRIESTCESLGSSFGGYDTNYGAEAQAYGDASLAVANPTASVGKNISNGLDQSLALASSKLDSMDIGSLQNMEQGSNRELSNEQLSQIYSDTAATIANGAAATFANLIPDMVNGVADWTERFLHQDSGSLGRVGQLVEVENEVAQGVVNDFRKITAVGTAMIPVMRVNANAGSIKNVNPLKGNQNCANCVVATDATLSGNPASALGGGPFSIKVLQRHYGRSFSSPISVNQISTIMGNAGHGSRGIVFGSRGNRVGHVFNVVNQKGNIRYLDGQSGKAADLAGYDSFRLLRTN